MVEKEVGMTQECSWTDTKYAPCRVRCSMARPQLRSLPRPRRCSTRYVTVSTSRTVRPWRAVSVSSLCLALFVVAITPQPPRFGSIQLIQR